MRKKKSQVLRALIEDEKILLRPGVAVALHAKLAEAAGFQAVGISGANVSAYLLGLPDAGLITMTEMCENAQRVAAHAEALGHAFDPELSLVRHGFTLPC